MSWSQNDQILRDALKSKCCFKQANPPASSEWNNKINFPPPFLNKWLKSTWAKWTWQRRSSLPEQLCSLCFPFSMCLACISEVVKPQWHRHEPMAVASNGSNYPTIPLTCLAANSQPSCGIEHVENTGATWFQKWFRHCLIRGLIIRGISGA